MTGTNRKYANDFKKHDIEFRAWDDKEKRLMSWDEIIGYIQTGGDPRGLHLLRRTEKKDITGRYIFEGDIVTIPVIDTWKKRWPNEFGVISRTYYVKYCKMREYLHLVTMDGDPYFHHIPDTPIEIIGDVFTEGLA